jgi:hypothetical protein
VVSCAVRRAVAVVAAAAAGTGGTKAVYLRFNYDTREIPVTYLSHNIQIRLFRQTSVFVATDHSRHCKYAKLLH